MKIDLGWVEIERIIFHEIPRKTVVGSSEKTEGPLLSEIESPLTHDQMVFFKDKITQGAGASSAFEISFKNEAESPVPGFIESYLTTDNADFVSLSQKLAIQLYEKQNRVNPTGLLAVIDCKINEQRALAILKVEKEEGVRLDQSTVGGRRTFDIQLIRDLLFTKKTKLFKLGLFVVFEDNDKSLIKGIACDEQRGSNPKVSVADFFLDDFLGCELVADPKLTTKMFYEATEDFINREISNPAEKALVLNHLVSKVTNNEITINPDGFAREFLSTPLRQRFVDHVAIAGIPNQAFVKDIQLVQNRIAKTLIEFESGIQVLGKIEAVMERVNMREHEDGNTELTIVDRVSRVTSK